jgi:hypothetical protein
LHGVYFKRTSFAIGPKDRVVTDHWNVIHVRRLGVVHWALLTLTVPYNHVRLLCEYSHNLSNSRYLALSGCIVRVETCVDVDCMACIARGHEP